MANSNSNRLRVTTINCNSNCSNNRLETDGSGTVEMSVDLFDVLVVFEMLFSDLMRCYSAKDKNSVPYPTKLVGLFGLCGGKPVMLSRLPYLSSPN